MMVLGGGAMGGALFPEGGARMNGLSALREAAQGGPWPLPVCEDTARRCGL